MTRPETASVDDTPTPVNKALPAIPVPDDSEDEKPSRKEKLAGDGDRLSLIESFAGRDSRERATKAVPAPAAKNGMIMLSKEKQNLAKNHSREKEHSHEADDDEDVWDQPELDTMINGSARRVKDFNRRIAEQQPDSVETPTPMKPHYCQEKQESLQTEDKSVTEISSGVVPNAFERMRPRRNPPEVATITIGSNITTSMLGPSSSFKRRNLDSTPFTPIRGTGLADDSVRQKFSSSMRAFVAPGSELEPSVDGPQSKSQKSPLYFGGLSDSEEEGSRVRDLILRASTPGEVDDGSPAQFLSSRADELLETFPVGAESDDDYLDYVDKKAREKATVAELIRQAEEKAATLSQDNDRRANQMLKGRGRKDSTTQFLQMIDASVERIDEQLQTLETVLQASANNYDFSLSPTAPTEETSAEERLSLTVSKADFADMHIVGQFNLGFILALRAPSPASPTSDLFIIDQHASDEKFNFERLQTNTIVQNQRLVHPRRLDLTAIEEEIILNNNETLLKNGFQVEIDTGGNEEAGHHCKLVSLPMSREVTFDITDLAELIALLAENPYPSSSENVPRPTKVRRMFAMRACRSSVMVGKTLTLKQMGALVRKMGEIDKPWNCPHGRPTMRHVCGLQEWEEWKEGGGLVGMEEEREKVEWATWIEDGTERRKETEEEKMEESGGNNSAA